MKNLQDFPRICLAALPTPIQKLENISRLLGTNIYIKRDDLTGIGLGGASSSSCSPTRSGRARRSSLRPAAPSRTTPC